MHLRKVSTHVSLRCPRRLTRADIFRYPRRLAWADTFRYSRRLTSADTFRYPRWLAWPIHFAICADCRYSPLFFIWAQTFLGLYIFCMSKDHSTRHDLRNLLLDINGSIHGNETTCKQKPTSFIFDSVSV